jgi:hypothetical protein
MKFSTGLDKVINIPRLYFFFVFFLFRSNFGPIIVFNGPEDLIDTPLFGILQNLMVVGHDHRTLEYVFFAERLKLTHYLGELQR